MNGEPSLGEISRQVQTLDARVGKMLDDHESRLRSCEKWKYAFPPTLLIAVSSALVAVFK